MPVVDLSNLIDNSMGDESFVNEMVAMFVTQGQEQLGQLEKVLASSSNDAWVEVSHSLKGTAAMVGAMAMRDLCATAQNSPGIPAPEKQAMIVKIKAEYQRACDELAASGRYQPAA